MKQSKKDVKSLVKQSAMFKDKTFLLIIAAAAAFFLAMFSFPHNPLFTRGLYQGFEEGAIAERDLFSDRTFTYADEEATRLKVEATIQLIPPVFIVQEEVTRRVLERFEVFSAIYSDSVIAGDNAERFYLELQAALPGLFSREDVNAIFEVEEQMEIAALSGDLLTRLMERGVLNIPENIPELDQGIIEIWNWIEGEKVIQRVKLDSVVSKNTLSGAVTEFLNERDLKPDDYEGVLIIVDTLVEENTFYNADETEAYRKRALEGIAAVEKKIEKGERIVKEGYTVTAEDMTKISFLDKLAKKENREAVFGTLFVVLVMSALILLLLNPPFTKSKLSMEQVYLLTGLGFLYLILYILIRRFGFLHTWVPFTVFLPSAFISMILTVLINSRIAVTFGLIISIITFTAYGTGPYPFLFSFLSAVAGSFVMRGTERRIDLVRANFFLTGFSGLIAGSLGFLQNYELTWFFTVLGWGALNGFVCGILNIAILPLLEHLLDAPTRFRLLELSDINAPMLKKMLTLAPGTYNHSVSVANLAEAACREIDANPLLARVGAYYHDIGKIEQPEYFIENQSGDNKHDELKPSLSAAVIKSHVKIGVEKGKELGLPKKVLDIIAQHHGSGLISYFYSEALKEQGNTKIDPEHYSYTEPPPTSKEAAVVLLADSVEATARTLKKPSVAKLEKLVWNIILDKFKNQQLNSSSLTFHDLEVIKKTFVHILAGYFHSRIEYPEMNEDSR